MFEHVPLLSSRQLISGCVMEKHFPHFEHFMGLNSSLLPSKTNHTLPELPASSPSDSNIHHFEVHYRVGCLGFKEASQGNPCYKLWC